MSSPEKKGQETISKRVTRLSLGKSSDLSGSKTTNEMIKENETNLEKENEKKKKTPKETTSKSSINQPKKRGRKPKAEMIKLNKNLKKDEPKTPSPSKKVCAGRSKKDTNSNENEHFEPKKKRIVNRKEFLDDNEDDYHEFSSIEEVKNDDSDDEFKLEDAEESEDEYHAEENVEEIESDNNNDSDFSDESFTKKKPKNNKKSTPKKSSTSKKTPTSPIETNQKEIDSYDINKKVENWDYELELENKYFKKPILPNLSEKALSQFLSKKSSKKAVIYECPFCKKIFTYQLVFKIHIFSCTENKNVPEYLLHCVDCDFKGAKRQEMIKHYIDEHIKDRENKEEKLSECKKNQLEVSRYFYINRNEFKYAFGYLNGLLSKKYKRLKFIDSFFGEQNNKVKPDFVLNYQHFTSESDLVFKLIENNENEDQFILKPFQIHFGYDFKVINLINQITALDWAHRNHDLNEKSNSQFLAVSTIPLNNLNTILNRKSSENNYQKYCLQTLFQSTNVIYIYKFQDLNSSLDVKKFGILNDEIGYVSCLRWRPDYGASLSNDTSSDFVGYLLAASSNGNGYIYYINDLTSQSTSENLVNIYHPKKEIVLKLSFSFGQCTSADWSQMNGATQIAIGYSNGSVALFHLNSNTLSDLLQFESSINDVNQNKMYIYPVKTFNAHLTFVKSVRWSKINNHILATGSLFSREIKVWDDRNLEKYILDYEIMITDMAFTLHSSDLFMAKEANLKGTNHLSALDLNYNIYNIDKDESRAHSSLFYTFSSMSSIDQSDYLNKLLVCDYDGSILLSRSNDTKFWTQKHKMMNHSFAQIAKFNVENIENETNSNKTYDLEDINKEKNKKMIVINLERVTNNKQNATKSNNSNQTNQINVDVNSLVKICWNPNVNCNNWYASASLSGFIFLHKLNEIENVKI